MDKNVQGIVIKKGLNFIQDFSRKKTIGNSSFGGNPSHSVQAALRSENSLPSSSLCVCSGWFCKMFHWLPSVSAYITFLSGSLTQFCGKHGCEHKGLYVWPRFFIDWLLAAAWGGDTYFSAFCICPWLKFKTIFLFRTTNCSVSLFVSLYFLPLFFLSAKGCLMKTGRESVPSASS